MEEFNEDVSVLPRPFGIIPTPGELLNRILRNLESLTIDEITIKGKPPEPPEIEIKFKGENS